MARLETRDETALSAATLQALEPTRMNGKLADVYLQFANSESSLVAYLGMENSLRNTSLSLLEIEAIKLLVSEINQCEFCLAMHSMKARKAGMDVQMQIAVRKRQPTGNARLDAILNIVQAFFNQPGTLSEELMHSARGVGVTDQKLMEIAMAVSTIFFTNIANHINDTAVTVTPAPSLD